MASSRMLFLVCCVFLLGSQCGSQQGSTLYPWDAKKVRSSLQILAQEAHPLGSARQKFLADWLQQEAKALGLNTSLDRFEVEVPDPRFLKESASLMQKTSLTLSAHNIYAQYQADAHRCVYLLGSHYDSKRDEEQRFLGANDSGSSSAALLEIMRLLPKLPALRCSVMAIWFDGEESYLKEWRDSERLHPSQIKDHLYGSRHLASQLKPCDKRYCLPAHLGGHAIEGLILLDMIGHPSLTLSRDSFSSPELLSLAERKAKDLFGVSLFTQAPAKLIEDDHVPFRDLGIPAVNLIDFENAETWHTASDTADRVSDQSIEKVGQLTLAMLEELLQK